MLLSVLSILSLTYVAQAAEVCYGDLGCFSNIAPFWGLNRPLSSLPDAPDVIGTKFYLYTRANPTMALRERLVADSPATLSASHFSANKPTRMIIHGFSGTAEHQWVQDIVDELLLKEDINVMTVDWSEGASIANYNQATANSRVVGAEVAKMVNYMNAQTGATARDFHLIGHSLGGHVAGYAGDILGTVGRITGLDISSPYFDGMEDVVKLDPTDAQFVDVIHSDGSPFIGTLGLGTSLPAGHVDFYPNGGEYQPGCHDNIISSVVSTGVGLLTDGYNGAEAAAACSHLRAIDYFKESINSECPFTAYNCDSYDRFKDGFCISCDNNACSQMGYRARDHYAGRGAMYLLTTDGTNPDGKFCSYHYKVQVTSSTRMESTVGRLYVTFQGPSGITDTMEITNNDGDNVDLMPGVTYQKLVSSHHSIGEISRVNVRFVRSSSIWDFFAAQYYGLGKVTITNGETQSSYRFCGSDTPINNGETLQLTTAGGNC